MMSESHYYIKIATNIIEFLYLIPVLTGLIFNILALMIFSRKKFEKTIFSTYFRYLCISDTIILLYKLDYMLKEKFFYYLFTIIYFCKILNYFLYILPSISNWILVIISIDRYLSIVYPTKFLFRKLKQNQILILFALIIFQAIVWLSIPFLAFVSITNNTTNESLVYDCLPGTITVDLIDLLDSSLLPSVLMFISTSLTLRTIFKSRSKSQNSNHQNEKSKIKSKDIKFAISSISLNVLFFVLNIPLSFHLLTVNFLIIDDYLRKLIYSVCDLLYYINYASVFFLSYFFNIIFKKEFLDFMNELKSKFF